MIAVDSASIEAIRLLAEGGKIFSTLKIKTMSRLFRGKVYHKNRKTGEYKDCGWIHGCLHNYYDGSFYTIITVIDNERMETIEYHVEPLTVGQSTGVKDNLGNDIYEGDILANVGEDGNTRYYPVVYNDKTGCYCIDNSYYKNNSHLVTMTEFFGSNLVVVGNVHDNPYLLPPQDVPLSKPETGETLQF